MARRRLLTRIVLILGLAGLVWGLVTLHGIFADERDDAIEAVEARRTALVEYASRSFSEALHNELGGAEPEVERAFSDPLAPGDGLLLIDHTGQLLPRLVAHLPGEGTPARDLLVALRTETEQPEAGEPPSHWAERLRLFGRLREALDTGRASRIEAALDDILAQRATDSVPESLDLPYLLAALERVAAESMVARDRIAVLLREGLPALRRGGTANGLQRQLLVARAHFTKPDFDFLAERITAISEAVGTFHTDFIFRTTEGQELPLPIAGLPLEPSLLLGGEWYVERRDDGRLVGTRVDLPALLQNTAEAMRHLALLGPADDLVLEPMTAAARPPGTLQVWVASTRWGRAYRDLEERYDLKSALVLLAGALALLIVALTETLRAREQRFVQLKSDFVAMVSHELRTPLTSIRLLAETLERRTQGLADVRDYPHRILSDIDGLSFLVENILSFNRLSKGRWTPHLERVALDELADELVAELHLLTAKEVVLDASGLTGATIRADGDLVKLALQNLVKNACQYGQRVPVRLALAFRRERGRAVVAVSDNGVGIPKSEQRHVFGEFYRPKRSNAPSRRGSGLGLAICRRVMSAHRGKIRLAATSEAGTTFELRFPG